MLLESEPGQKGKASGRWDQFATNQQLFGTATSYNEDLYTTKLDAGASGISVQEAERLAAEIQGGTTSNRHLAEERGAHIDDSGVWLLLPATLRRPHHILINCVHFQALWHSAASMRSHVHSTSAAGGCLQMGVHIEALPVFSLSAACHDVKHVPGV